MLMHHVNRSFPNFRGILFCRFLFHCSILSKVGASEKTGTSQFSRGLPKQVGIDNAIRHFDVGRLVDRPFRSLPLGLRYRDWSHANNDLHNYRSF